MNNIIEVKYCKACEKNKLIDEFYASKTSKDKLQSICKICFKKNASEYRKNNKERIKESFKVYYENNKEKERERNKNNYDQHKDDRKEKAMMHRQENKEYYKLYYKKDSYKLYQKKRRQGDSYRESERIRNNEKYKNDIQFKLRKVLRNRLRGCVKENYKGKMLDLLQCDIDSFKKWIEYQFTSEMTWDNYGTYWHIDHCIPCASFDLSSIDEQKKCFCWKNMRPLKADENIIKGDKIDEDIIKKHNIILRDYISKLP